DLSLTRDTTTIPLTGVQITQVNDTTFRVGNLGPLTQNAGDYAFGVDASGVVDLWDNTGTGIVIENWTTAPNVPVITSLGAGVSPLSNQPVDHIEVAFSKDLNTSTFDLNDITLTHNGAPVALEAPANVTSTSDSVFHIEGLAPFTSQAGDYELTVTATGVTDQDGAAGLGEASVAWSLDVTAPSITLLQSLTTNPRNIAVLSLDVDFTEPIDLDSMDPSDFVLTRDGGSDLFTAGLVVNPLPNNRYEISGFTALTGVPGDYTFTVLGAGLTDPAGNPVTNDASTTWTLDIQAPPAPTDLAINPGLNQPGNMGRTNTQTVTLTGTLGEPDLTVRVVDTTSGQSLGAAITTGTAFTKELDLGVAGNHRLRVYTVDDAGNVSPNVFFDVFVDETLPFLNAIEGVDNPKRLIPVDQLTFVFSEPIKLSSFTTEDITLTLDGQPVSLTGASIVQDSPTRYRLTGLTSLTDALGDYTVTVDVTGVMDLADNPGDQILGIAWTLAEDNSPPQIADQSFTIDENSTLGYEVGTVVATDPDVGDSLTYAITGGNGSGAFAIDDNGLLTVANGGPIDFEQNPSFALTVEVTDTAGVSGSATVTVDLNDLNDETPVVAPNQSFAVLDRALPGRVIGQLNASDPDANTTLSQWGLVNNQGAEYFEVDPDTGELRVAGGAPLTELTGTTYPLSVTVFDGQNTSTPQTVTIDVLLSEPTDFNGNGLNDPEDLDMMSRAINEAANAPAPLSVNAVNHLEPYDLNKDGTVDAEDGRIMLAVIYDKLPGDINLDDLINITDLVAWAGGFGGEGLYSNGDTNFDGNVDVQDLINWASRFGLTTSPIPGDFNNDLTVDIEDVNLMSYAIQLNSHAPRYDLEPNGDVDLNDGTAMLRDFFNALPGDFNLDSTVDINFGAQVAPLTPLTPLTADAPSLSATSPTTGDTESVAPHTPILLYEPATAPVNDSPINPLSQEAGRWDNIVNLITNDSEDNEKESIHLLNIL
ncbi:MAG: cadherin domain-containing protein, partial [Planctomycetota bacterium]